MNSYAIVSQPACELPLVQLRAIFIGQLSTKVKSLQLKLWIEAFDLIWSHSTVLKLFNHPFQTTNTNG